MLNMLNGLVVQDLSKTHTLLTTYTQFLPIPTEQQDNFLEHFTAGTDGRKEPHLTKLVVKSRIRD